MADVNQKDRDEAAQRAEAQKAQSDTERREERRDLEVVRNSKGELVARDVGIEPRAVPQSTFPSTMREGLPGMVNRMVDYNAVSRSCDTAAGIPPARAVSQGTWDGGCVLGGTANGFLGLSILDPTLIVTQGAAPETYQQFNEIGILTKGEMFATSVVAIAAGDPLTFIAADGTLSNTGGVAVPGGRWKYARPTPGDLNVVQLGIQR
jgi:hypothetical protein